MKSAVFFYSLTGNSRVAAQHISNIYKTDIYELKEKGNRKGLLGFIKGGYEALKKKQLHLIKEPWEHIKNYEKLFLVFPIWANNIHPAINTLLDHADFDDKYVSIITLHASPDTNSTQNVRDELSKLIKEQGGSIDHAISITATKKTEETKIIYQLKKALG